MAIKENHILIGSKDFIQYMRSVGYLFRNKNLKEIVLKARGKNMNKAIDLATACRNDFFPNLDLNIKSIKIGTEEFEKEGKKRTVSHIEITLNK